MTNISISTHSSARNGLALPIQRTLIVTLGKMAAELDDHLAPAFGEQGPLSGAVARLSAGTEAADRPAAIRDKLAGISRAAAPPALASNGYVMDRLRELLLLLVVDLTDPAAVSRAGEIARSVSGIAQTGWGLDTRVIAVALAEDWSQKTAAAALRSFSTAMSDLTTAIIPLNHVNELGLQMDDRPAFMARAAAILEALVATPLRDALEWSNDVPEPRLTDATLTTVGLARWQWDPEPVRDHLADTWRAAIIGRWLGTAEPERALPAAQRAASWFAARSLLPAALMAALERSVEPVPVPSWPVPYPWAAARAVDRLRHLSGSLAGGRAGVVELMLDEWADWPAEQAQTLAGEIAGQLDREPLAGFDLAGHFLRGLTEALQDAFGWVEHRQDQLEEHATGLLAQRDDLLAAIDSLLGNWPSGSPVAWVGLLWRPWRWPGLARDYWALHHLAGELEAVVTHQAAIEREQVVVAATASLYRRYEAAIRHTVDHVEEVADMLGAVRAARPHADAPPYAGRLVALDNMELEATEAAAALGGLGRLATALDEELVSQLRDLSRERFRFVIEWTAVSALERLTAGQAPAAEWWAAQWAEATPLWLYDDAGQPEESRETYHAWTAVCAADVDRLQALLGLPERPDSRWLPSADRRHIYLLRWRTGVAQ